MVKAVTEMKVADLLKEYKDTFQDHWEMYDKTFMALKKRLIEESLEAERSEFICSRYYQRSKERKDYRNGHWKRYIILKDGRLEISMPGIRKQGNTKIHPENAGSK